MNLDIPIEGFVFSQLKLVKSARKSYNLVLAKVRPK